MWRILLTVLSLTHLMVGIRQAGAWGHLDFVGSDWGQSTLAYALVHRGKLSYCVLSEVPEKFPPKNISQQVFQALKLWVSAAEKYKTSPIQEVDCKTGKPDLITQVGPEHDFIEMSGYHVPQMDSARFYSLVKLNSNYTYTEAKVRYQVVDFAQLVPFSQSLLALIHEVSTAKPMTVGDFSGKYKMHYQRAYLSTYKMLLHEIGHAFGLCDTESSLFKYCDIKYRTGTRPPAVMNQADFFYLTEDDKAGLSALLQRFELFKN